MSKYTPDRWTILRFDRPSGESIYKVFAGWYGGYTQGDSWKLNSGIVKVVDTGDAYEFHGNSGSIYVCYKFDYGTSGYMESVLGAWKKQVSELPGYAVVECQDWDQKLEVLSG